MTKKKGLPRALQVQETDENGDPIEDPKQTPEEFAREFFGEAGEPKDQELGMPTREWLKDQYKTKSAAVRYLVSRNYAIKDIAKHLDMKYQHVRNVATNPLKRGPNEDWRPKAERKEHFGE